MLWRPISLQVNRGAFSLRMHETFGVVFGVRSALMCSVFSP